MNRTELLEALKTKTAQPPPGAKARVWRRLQQPSAVVAPVRWVPALALVGACLVAVLAWTQLRTTPPEPITSERWVLVKLPGASLSGKSAVRTLEKGEIVASVWGERLELKAAGRTVWAEGAVFAMEVGGEALRLDVKDGVVSVDGERVEGGHWPVGSAFRGHFTALAGLEPVSAADERHWVLAEDAASQGAFTRAVERFDELGRRDGLRAEAALLRKGQLELWNLRQPAQALETFGVLHARFPGGSLRQEAELSALEASAQLEDWGHARTQAREFLTAFPGSERRAEVGLIGALGALRLGDPAVACHELQGLELAKLGPKYQPAIRELQAGCEKK